MNVQVVCIKCMYIRVHAYMYILTYIHVHAYIAGIHVHVHVCMYAHTHLNTCHTTTLCIFMDAGPSPWLLFMRLIYYVLVSHTVYIHNVHVFILNSSVDNWKYYEYHYNYYIYATTLLFPGHRVRWPYLFLMVRMYKENAPAYLEWFCGWIHTISSTVWRYTSL